MIESRIGLGPSRFEKQDKKSLQMIYILAEPMRVETDVINSFDL